MVEVGSVENMGKGFLNEGAFSSKRLRERMQSFAWADAKLCVGGCKALRERWAKLEDSLAVITAGDVCLGNQKR